MNARPKVSDNSSACYSTWEILKVHVAQVIFCKFIVFVKQNSYESPTARNLESSNKLGHISEIIQC